jgi:hypothetical protein
MDNLHCDSHTHYCEIQDHFKTCVGPRDVLILVQSMEQWLSNNCTSEYKWNNNCVDVQLDGCATSVGNLQMTVTHVVNLKPGLWFKNTEDLVAFRIKFNICS